MNRRTTSALVLIGLTVVVLMVNRGSISVDLVLDSVKAMAALVYLGFVVVGIIIGMLLK